MIPRIFNNIKTINVYYKLCNKTGMSTIHVADKHENKNCMEHIMLYIYIGKMCPNFHMKITLKQSFTLFSLVPYVSMVIRG